MRDTHILILKIIQVCFFILSLLFYTVLYTRERELHYFILVASLSADREEKNKTFVMLENQQKGFDLFCNHNK
jgi:cytochrome c-type biogenesis protein CcmE